PGVQVRVPLDGVTGFALRLSDGGGGTVQGVDFNQIDWADAQVTLRDGSTVRLGDLPTGPLRSAYTPEPPFSFRYGDRPSSELLKTWKVWRDVQKLDENRTQHTSTYTDPKTGLVVRCVAVEYADFPAGEWTVY